MGNFRIQIAEDRVSGYRIPERGRIIRVVGSGSATLSMLIQLYVSYACTYFKGLNMNKNSMTKKLFILHNLVYILPYFTDHGPCR